MKNTLHKIQIISNWRETMKVYQYKPMFYQSESHTIFVSYNRSFDLLSIQD